MRTLSARERRLVAILLLIALLALVQLAVIGPIVSGFTSRAERREALLLTYQRNARIIANIPRLRRQAERQRATVGRVTLPAGAAEPGGEMLKERLQHAVEGVGGEFRGAEDVTAPAGWVRASVGTRLTASQLNKLLASLENSQPYLIINSLLVTADEALIAKGPSQLDVQLEATIPLRATATR
jgi:general secretion pathway protein M